MIDDDEEDDEHECVVNATNPCDNCRRLEAEQSLEDHLIACVDGCDHTKLCPLGRRWRDAAILIGAYVSQELRDL